MRVAPIGLVYASERWDELLRVTYESAVPTHGGLLAISAAAAAAAISGTIAGASASDVLTCYPRFKTTAICPVL